MSPLFSREYIAMALSGSMQMERVSLKISHLHVFIEKSTILIYFLLFPLARIPVVNWFWEFFIRNFGQNFLGFLLRACYYKAVLKRMGSDVFFDYNTHLWCPKNISIGSNVHVSSGVVMWAAEGGIEIGCRINIGYYSLIQGKGGVVIEDDCSISPGVAIYSATHYQWFPDGRRMAVSPMGFEEQFIKKGSILLRHHSFIKYGSLLTHGENGIEIGPYGFILPYTLVKESVPPETMVGGVPAKKIRDWREHRDGS